MSVVLWHDLECGPYAQDLSLWRELARDGAGAVLDIGAGTGRVSLDLARAGHEVVALDRDAELLDALAQRTGDLAVTTVLADARTFSLQQQRFALVIVPMQTIQLLGGEDGRGAFLACAREHLAPGGRIAIALADALEGFDAQHDEPPLPDLREIDGVVYSSQPIAVREHPRRVAIHRRREIVDRRGARDVHEDVIELDRLAPHELIGEGERAGLRAEALRQIPATAEYVGSTVVVLRG